MSVNFIYGQVFVSIVCFLHEKKGRLFEFLSSRSQSTPTRICLIKDKIHSMEEFVPFNYIYIYMYIYIYIYIYVCMCVCMCVCVYVCKCVCVCEVECRFHIHHVLLRSISIKELFCNVSRGLNKTVYFKYKSSDNCNKSKKRKSMPMGSFFWEINLGSYMTTLQNYGIGTLKGRSFRFFILHWIKRFDGKPFFFSGWTFGLHEIFLQKASLNYIN